MQERPILSPQRIAGFSMETESVNETTADLAERIVSLAAAKPTDKVTILGNREIELLLTLARQGFIEVTCRETAGGPPPMRTRFRFSPSARERDLHHPTIF